MVLNGYLNIAFKHYLNIIYRVLRIKFYEGYSLLMIGYSNNSLFNGRHDYPIPVSYYSLPEFSLVKKNYLPYCYSS